VAVSQTDAETSPVVNGLQPTASEIVHFMLYSTCIALSTISRVASGLIG
jgi:hypothetical protein